MDRRKLALAVLVGISGAAQGVHCDKSSAEICEEQYDRCNDIALNDEGKKICIQQREWCHTKVQEALRSND